MYHFKSWQPPHILDIIMGNLANNFLGGKTNLWSQQLANGTQLYNVITVGIFKIH